MATKEPVKKISVEGRKDEWRTHKVVRVSEDDKVTVFSSRYNAQAQKFDQAIKEAEKEVEKGPRT
jgi:predicted adenine nucleotide alpha hydrolase (AANH) superfamily ATPase